MAQQAFWASCRTGDTETLKILRDCVQIDKEGFWAFKGACNYGNTYAAKLLYSWSRPSSEALVWALTRSIINGHLRIAKWLYGLNVEPSISLAFWRACANEQVQAARWLTRRYGHIFKKQQLIDRTFTRACLCKSMQILKWLIQFVSNQTIRKGCKLALIGNHVHVFKFLCKKVGPCSLIVQELKGPLQNWYIRFNNRRCLQKVSCAYF
jgi:hypothetical protein